LADRSIKYSLGVIEDVLVKVDKSISLQISSYLIWKKIVLLILGRPFLATGRTLIDVKKGKLILQVQNE